MSIERFERIASDWGLEVERRVVRPAAYVEAARFEVQVSPRGLRHMARPAPWMNGTSLRMLGRDALRGTPVIVRRVGRLRRHLDRASTQPSSQK
jgi:hypothetical protein